MEKGNRTGKRGEHGRDKNAEMKRLDRRAEMMKMKMAQGR